MNVKDFVSVLGNPLGDEYSVFDLLGETPDFSGENPVLLLHPTGLSFGRAVSSALSVRKAETPDGVCLGDGGVFVAHPFHHFPKSHIHLSCILYKDNPLLPLL